MANPAWQVSGEYFETCSSCDYVCACICGTGLFPVSVGEMSG